ncbi:hypothetical protein SKAU_G00166370 [Synaphobranchus kaupii]|uniref:Uncharacterized protein n=1 Tax=Synaphobranchus kaupii TaxID=118154 RepID=A0A9Q1FJJ0_SYNKA|nr:hypothetical protein SKAU_G00166370 [Synaphobranchus kaupii]
MAGEEAPAGNKARRAARGKRRAYGDSGRRRRQNEGRVPRAPAGLNVSAPGLTSHLGRLPASPLNMPSGMPPQIGKQSLMRLKVPSSEFFDWRGAVLLLAGQQKAQSLHTRSERCPPAITPSHNSARRGATGALSPARRAGGERVSKPQNSRAHAFQVKHNMARRVYKSRASVS